MAAWIYSRRATNKRTEDGAGGEGRQTQTEISRERRNTTKIIIVHKNPKSEGDRGVDFGGEGVERSRWS